MEAFAPPQAGNKIVTWFRGQGHTPPKRDILFPALDCLPEQEKAILSSSNDIEGHQGQSGEAFYRKMDAQRRATVLNLFEKMRQIELPDGSTFLSHVKRIWRDRKDRIFVIADRTLPGLVEESPLLYRRTKHDSLLHHAGAPKEFAGERRKLGSFKTFERHGNGDFTFTSVTDETGDNVAVECDQDEEKEGFTHLMRVIYHTGLDKKTNAYKIGEIDARQGIDTLYRIVPRHAQIEAGYVPVPGATANTSLAAAAPRPPRGALPDGSP